MIGEGERKARGNVGLSGDGQKGGEGTEKNLGLETGVSEAETDGWHGKWRRDPRSRWGPQE